jgi:hypothetical protein
LTASGLFPPCLTGPADVRMVSPFNLAAEAVFSYVSGSSLRKTALQQMRVFANVGLSPEVVSANCLSFGANLSQWAGLSSAQKQSLQTSALHALVFSMRLLDAEYRATKITSLLSSAEGSDVIALLVHYDSVTGSEDEGELSLDHEVKVARLIDDLPRLRDAMRKNRPSSALIILDAPVQGRKTCFDTLAIKHWTALGGWYVSPTVAPRQVSFAILVPVF